MSGQGVRGHGPNLLIFSFLGTLVVKFVAQALCFDHEIYLVLVIGYLNLLLVHIDD